MISINEHIVEAGAKKLADQVMPNVNWEELRPEVRNSFCDNFRDAYNAAMAANDQRADRYYLQAELYQREDEWVLQLEGTINDTWMTVRHTEPLSTPVEDVPGLPSYLRPEEMSEEPTVAPGM
jgi:hypothetical protein